MGLSKQQIKDHIASVSKNLQSEQERIQHGFEFAKLCFRVEDYESAIRYLEKYLVANGRDYRAQKWMGRLYEAVSDNVKAVVHYEKSLELQPDQRNIVLKVADLHLGFDQPSKGALQKCLQAVERMDTDHPLTFVLYEKLQGLDGKELAIDKFLTQQLNTSSPDPDCCIQLVKRYLKLGKNQQAFRCCQVVDGKRLFEESLTWQEFSLGVAELQYQDVCKTSDVDGCLNCCVAIMRRCSNKFRLHLDHDDTYVSWKVGSEVELYSLLLKFDRILLKASTLLSSISPGSKVAALMVVKELRGQLYLMAAQYLYVKDRSGNFQQQGSLQVPLADLCLLVSLKTAPPDIISLGPLSLSSKLKVEEWRSIACARWSTVGWQLMARAAHCGRTYLEGLTERVGSKGVCKLVLSQELFGQHEHKVNLGSDSITYDTKQSVIAMDDSILKVRPDLPAVDDLMTCDSDFVTIWKFDMHRLLLRWLCYEVLESVAPVSKWLEIMFPDLQWTTTDLCSVKTDCLCRLHLEAYLVIQYDELKQKLRERDKDLVTVVEKSFLCWKTSQSSTLNVWKGVATYLDGSSSVTRTLSHKKEVQRFLDTVRGLSTTLEQLILLARHFKKQAEQIDEQKGDDNPYSHRSTVKTLLQLSSHYWTIVIERIRKMTTSVSTKKRRFNRRDSASSYKTKDADVILAEAQFSLGKAALYNNDPTLALQHFSQVSTPQAAWNQAQIYMLLADQEDADPHTSMSYIQKALTLTRTSVNQSEFVELQERLQNRKDEIKQLLKRSYIMDSGGVEYEDGSPVPQLYSTPANPQHSREKPIDLDKDGTPVVTAHYPFTIYGDHFGENLQDTLRDKDQQISDMVEQLQQLQDEMKELRKMASSFERNQSFDENPLRLSANSVQSPSDLDVTDASDMVLSTSRSVTELSPQVNLRSWPSMAGSQLTSVPAPLGLPNVPSFPTSRSTKEEAPNMTANPYSHSLDSILPKPNTIASLPVQVANFATAPAQAQAVAPSFSVGHAYVRPDLFSAHASSQLTSAGNQATTTAGAKLGESLFSFNLLSSTAGLSLPVGAESFSPATKGISQFSIPLNLATTASASSVSSAASTISSTNLFSTTPLPFKFGSAPATTTANVSIVPSSSLFSTVQLSAPFKLPGSAPVATTANAASVNVGNTIPSSSLFSTVQLSAPFKLPGSAPVATTANAASVSVGNTTSLFSTTQLPFKLPGSAPVATTAIQSSVSSAANTISSISLFSTVQFSAPFILPGSAPVATTAGSAANTTSTIQFSAFQLPGSAPVTTTASGAANIISSTTLFSTTPLSFKLPGSAPVATTASGAANTISSTSLSSINAPFGVPVTTTANASSSVNGTTIPFPTVQFSAPIFSSPGTTTPSVESAGVSISSGNIFSTPQFNAPFNFAPVVSLAKPPSVTSTIAVSSTSPFSTPSALQFNPLPNFSPSAPVVTSTNALLRFSAPVAVAPAVTVVGVGSSTTPFPKGLFAPKTTGYDSTDPPVPLSPSTGPASSFKIPRLTTDTKVPTSEEACSTIAPVSSCTSSSYHSDMSTIAPSTCVSSLFITSSLNTHSLTQFGRSTVSSSSESYPILSSLLAPVTEINVSDVIFIREEVPRPELVARAEKFMLPPSFYLYENKPPCPGCRGCEEDPESAPTKNKAPPALAEKVTAAKSLPTPSSQAGLSDHQSGFSSAGMMSFSDIVSQSANSFGKAKGFVFQGTGSQLFSAKQAEGSDNPEDEVDIEYKPIVTLPETVSLKSWDDDADTLFVHRSKLFRYDAGSQQWKERGVGDMKIMKHKTSGRVRLIMRRDQILKICCNHYITEEMKLLPGQSEKSWMWFTHSDYSDETPKEEKMAVRFKHVETAAEFKRVFEECVSEAEQAAKTHTEKSFLPAMQPVQPVDTWECGGCYVSNISENDTCVACGAPKRSP